MNLSIASGYEIDTLTEDDPGPGDKRDVPYTAFEATLNYNIMLGEKTRLWFGAGYQVGGVGGTSINGFRAVAGILRQVSHYVVLRVEGTFSRGENDFAQEWVNGGIVLWLN